MLSKLLELCFISWDISYAWNLGINISVDRKLAWLGFHILNLHLRFSGAVPRQQKRAILAKKHVFWGLSQHLQHLNFWVLQLIIFFFPTTDSTQSEQAKKSIKLTIQFLGAQVLEQILEKFDDEILWSKLRENPTWWNRYFNNRTSFIKNYNFSRHARTKYFQH